MPRKKTPTDMHAAAVALGSKGGKAKAKKLTPADRKALGEQLAKARKQIPAEERKRIAKIAVAKREEYRRQRKERAKATAAR
jgi:hypothetical protein